eukprot:scaffold111_cov201-Chaetoceros_neogracile.AAC.4
MPSEEGMTSSDSQGMAYRPDRVSAPPFARSARERKKVSGQRVRTRYLYYRWRDNKSVPTPLKMRDIFIFFCEDVGIIKAACNVLHFNEFFLNLFSDGVFADLDISDSLGCHIVGPLDACSIIVVDNNGTVSEKMEETE